MRLRFDVSTPLDASARLNNLVRIGIDALVNFDQVRNEITFIVDASHFEANRRRFNAVGEIREEVSTTL